MMPFDCTMVLYASLQVRQMHPIGALGVIAVDTGSPPPSPIRFAYSTVCFGPPSARENARFFFFFASWL